MKNPFFHAVWVAIISVLEIASLSVHAEPSNAASTKTANAKGRTVLFMDWSSLDKGNWQPVFDTNRLTDDARKQFDEFKKGFNIETRLGEHGMVPVHVPNGVWITIEEAQKSPRWLAPDQPWEKHIYGATVIHENGKYRCWYPMAIANRKRDSVFDAERQMEITGGALAYAESTDGFHWVKPSLGLMTYAGSTSNNLITQIQMFTIFRDDHGKTEERYKSFEFAELPTNEVPREAKSMDKYGLYAVVSPDGFHWKRLPRPVVRHFCDTFNIGAWDPSLKKYVGYFRGHSLGRSITRSETEDFSDWPPPQSLMTSGPEDPAGDDLYSNGFTFYPGEQSIRLLFPAVYHRTTDHSDVRMAISSDGQSFNWVSRQPILKCGGPGDWDVGQLYAQPSLVRLPDGRLALPYNGYGHTHNASFHNYYKDANTESGLGWALWEDGRLAGLEADETGDFYCSSSESLGSQQILLNARTRSGGRIELELVQKDKPVPGFTFADCIPFEGDGKWVGTRWRGKADSSALAGKRVQLHFRLTKAKLFGYRIPPTDS